MIKKNKMNKQILSYRDKSNALKKNRNKNIVNNKIRNLFKKQ